MLTKGAIGNLINRYRAVLKKCHLINTFGSLAVASMLVLGGAGVAGAGSSYEDLKTLTQNETVTEGASEVKKEVTDTYGPDGAVISYTNSSGNNYTLTIQGTDAENRVIFDKNEFREKAGAETAPESGVYGGVIAVSNVNVTMKHVSLTNNSAISESETAAVQGGAYHQQNGSFSADDIFVSGNKAVTDGSKQVQHQGKPYVPGYSLGSAFCFNNADAEIKNSTFLANGIGSDGAASLYGGAIYFNGANTLTIKNSVFEGNELKPANETASTMGGALYMSGNSSTKLYGVTFSKNKAKSSYWSYGGAIFNYGTIDIDNINNFSENIASVGGAIYNAGTVDFNDASKNTFSKNKSTYGGAIFSSGTLNIKGVNSFTENSADYGGAIYNEGSLTLMGDNTFSGNTATAGADIYSTGKLIFDGGETTMDGGVEIATENAARGLNVQNGAKVTINGGFTATESGDDNGGLTRLVNNYGGTLNIGEAGSNDVTNITVTGKGDSNGFVLGYESRNGIRSENGTTTYTDVDAVTTFAGAETSIIANVVDTHMYSSAVQAVSNASASAVINFNADTTTLKANSYDKVIATAVADGAEAKFSFGGKDVVIENIVEFTGFNRNGIGGTAEGIELINGADLDVNLAEGGKMDISASSNFGAIALNVVTGATADIQSGEVILNSYIDNAHTNGVAQHGELTGLAVGNSSSFTLGEEASLTINTHGAGLWNGTVNDSAGTVGINLLADGSTGTAEFNGDVTINVNSVDTYTTPAGNPIVAANMTDPNTTGKTISPSWGLRVAGAASGSGNFDITVKDGHGDAYGMAFANMKHTQGAYEVGTSSLSGSHTLNVTAAGAAYGVYAADGADVTLGDISVVSSSAGKAYGVYAKEASITAGDLTSDTITSTASKAYGIQIGSDADNSAKTTAEFNSIALAGEQGEDGNYAAAVVGKAGATGIRILKNTELTVTGDTIVSVQSAETSAADHTSAIRLVYDGAASFGGTTTVAVDASTGYAEGILLGNDTENQTRSITLNDTNITVTGSAVNVSGIKNYYSDVDINGAAKITVTNTSADASQIYGIANMTSGAATTDFSSNVTVSVEGVADTYGVYGADKGSHIGFNGTESTVEISATSTGADAYGIQTLNGGEVISAAGSTVTITADAAKNAYGVYAANSMSTDAVSAVAFGGTTSIKATAADAANAHALYGSGSITNTGALTVEAGLVDEFTGTYSQTKGSTSIKTAGSFFGGAVNLTGGSLTAHTVNADQLTLGEATLHATNALNLQGADLTVGNKATLIVGDKIDNAVGTDPAYQGGGIKFDGGTIIVNGGTFIADKDVVLDDKFAAKEGMAAGIVGTAGDVKLDLAVANGTGYKAGEYTNAQLANATNSLFADNGENAKLSFLNGIAAIDKNSKVLVEATSGREEGKLVATIGAGALPTEVGAGQSLEDMTPEASHAEDYYNNKIRIAEADGGHNALDVDKVNAHGAKFDAGFIEVAARDDGNGGVVTNREVMLEFGKDSNGNVADIHLSGYHHDSDHHGIVSDSEGNELQVSFEVKDGATFTFGHDKNSQLRQEAAINDALITDGTHTVNGGNHHDDAEHDGAYYTDITYENVKMGEKGKFDILNAAARINGLSGSGGRIYIDPAYVHMNTTLSSLDTNVTVAQGSVVEVGTQSAALRDIAGEVFGASNSQDAALGGFTLKGNRAILSLLGSSGIQMAELGALEVNGEITDSAHAAPAQAVTFGKGSLLVVDADKVKNAAAITGAVDATDGSKLTSISVDSDAKLYIANATGNATYVIADQFKDVTLAGWDDANLIANGLFNVSADKDAEGDGIIVTTTNKDVEEAFPGAAPVVALNKLIEDGVQTDASDAGKAFLSRATDPTFIADAGKAVATINEVSRAAVTAGVQNTSLRIADAASNTVLGHMSLAQHDGSKAIHSEGADFWAAPMYGNLYTSGMNVAGSSVRGQFGGLALGVDTEGGQFLGGKLRVGASINGGGGQSETKGGATSTQNDYDFGGLNVYAGWNKGALNVIGSVGYGFGNHEVEMGLPSSLGMGSAKADIDTTVFTADLRAEYQLKTNWLDVLPHAGIRYTALNTGAHDLKVGGKVLNSVASDTQNIVQFPIGVTLTKDFDFSGWNVKPMADISVIPAAGEKKAFTKVNFSGLNAVDGVNSRIMDSTSWAGTIGVQAEKGNFTLGLNYGVQASSNEADQNIQLKLGWKF